jgi:hypothetical protein
MKQFNTPPPTITHKLSTTITTPTNLYNYTNACGQNTDH